MAAIIVLLDMEWIEQENRNAEITQMAALRVDEAWNPLDSFEAVIRTALLDDFCPEHMAFSGYPRDRFEAGETEADAVRRFSEWLREDDSICVWHPSTRKTLSAAWQTVFQAELPCLVVCVNMKVCRAVHPGSGNPENLYSIARAAKETVLTPHHAVDDAELLRRLLNKVGFPQKKLRKERGLTDELQSLPERNRSIIGRTQYNYIFLPSRPVFHTKNCPCVLRARKIEGSITFKTAAKTRRPCKICKPVPDAKAEIRAKQINRQKAKKTREPEVDNSEIIKVKLLGGKIVKMRRGRIVGCCHNRIHPGKVTKAIMTEHRCLAKKCPFLERYETAPFWEQREAIKAEKESAKQSKKERKAMLSAEAESLTALRDEFQKYADDTNAEIEIIRVEHPNSYTYNVFYVSDNRFADADRFHGFRDVAREGHNWHRVFLRHIKDVDGHFVTREEYHARKR